jgi:hypothetical protein
MANTIRIKRRAAAGLAGAPSALKNGELAYSEKDNILYYGFGDDGSGNATTIPGIAGTGLLLKTDFSNAASTTQNYVLAAPSGANGAPTLRLLVASDIPTLTAAKIDDFDTQVRTNRLDQLAAPTASVSLNSQKIISLATPTADTDAATKGYVDSVAQGLDAKQSVRAATTANITLSGTQTIDGVALVANDRVLVKNQSTASQNGIYVVAAGAWTRAADMDAWSEVPSAFAFVETGTANGATSWVCTSLQGGTLDTTSIVFTQFGSASAYTAGNGLTLTGNQFDVVTANSGRIVVNADSIDLATAGTAGTYRSVTTDAYGRVTSGTNPTTLAGYGITDAQALDATLTALAGVGTGADQLIYATGTDAFATTTFTSFGRSLVDDVDAAAARTTLGLNTMATQASSNVSITGGSITNLTTFDGVTIDGGTY